MITASCTVVLLTYLVAACVLMLVCEAETPQVELLFNSSCGAMIQSIDRWDMAVIHRILPRLDFWKNLINHSITSKDILLVDVDKYTWQLLINQITALRMGGSTMAVYAVAYDNEACSHLSISNVHCYYDEEWLHALVQMYQSFTHVKFNNDMHKVMMGRMMTSAVVLCAGYNVFLSDTDVVFYRNPLDYAFTQADIMITAIEIEKDNRAWGGNFLSDQPHKLFSLNNGVVYYRNSELMRKFLLSLALNSANSLHKNPDWEKGFLQTTFNGIMREHKLHMQPYR